MKNNIILHIIVSFLIVYQTNGLPLAKHTSIKRNKLDEHDHLFEGDIRLPPSTSRGAFMRGDAVAWPNGVVPYLIAPGYEPEQEQFIIATMLVMEKSIAVNNVSCIHFRPKTPSDQYYITIRNNTGCSSFVGLNPNMRGERTVSLEHPGCIRPGIIMHELLHTLGFQHEQSRPDRDNYVKIHSENIRLGKEHNFEKYDSSFVDTQNTPYDYGSVMHYDKYAFSKNLPTIEALEPNVTIGQRVWMSPIDIEEVRLAYNCRSTGIIPPIDATTTTVSNYSSALTTNHKIFVRPGIFAILDYYYEAIEIIVDRTGIYNIMSLSNMNTVGYIYENTFNPLNPSSNLYIEDDENGGNKQFKLTFYVEANVPYTLVVSTFFSSTTGPFSVIATGPGSVQYISTDASITTTVPTTTRPSIIDSYYSNELTFNSETFSRTGISGSVYYYNAIEVTVKTTGTYTFKSSSSLDTYGYLYRVNFNPSYPMINVVASNDDGASSAQFQLTGDLQSDIKYILVVTTYRERMTGQFNIIASGPDDISFNSISNQ
jgi:hypothetical protein